MVAVFFRMIFRTGIDKKFGGVYIEAYTTQLLTKAIYLSTVVCRY